MLLHLPSKYRNHDHLLQIEEEARVLLHFLTLKNIVFLERYKDHKDFLNICSLIELKLFDKD